MTQDPSVDTEGVHAIANTEQPDRRADVIFVHGLGGSSHATWRYGKEGTAEHFFWPKELGAELRNIGVWTLGYAAGITQFGEPGLAIRKRAENLAYQMDLCGLGDRPIIFVTHSMGGLVVKQMLVSCLLSDKRSLQNIAARVRGVVFCGTPHRGSAFAWAAKALGVAQDHVKQMETNADDLDHLHDDFLKWHRQNAIAVETYAESLQLFRKNWLGRFLPLGIVVPRASANPGIGEVHDVDADHLALVKPTPSVQPIYNVIYRGVKRFIEHSLEPGSGLRSSQTAPSGPVGKLIVQVMQEMERSGITESPSKVANMPSDSVSHVSKSKGPQPKVAVSYAWREEREGQNAAAVDQFCAQLKNVGIQVVRDVHHVKLGDSLSEFMQSIGASDFLCVFLSDAYLKSPNCMYELLVAWQRSKDNGDQFRQRVKCWLMPGFGGIATLPQRAPTWNIGRTRVKSYPSWSRSIPPRR